MMDASEGQARSSQPLSFTEALALKVALGMIQRGENPLPGMSTVCILALARLTETPLVMEEGV